MPIISPWLYYWLTRLFILKAVGGVAAVVGIIMMIIAFVAMTEGYTGKKIFVWALSFFLVGGTLTMAIPTKQEAAIMVAMHYTTYENVDAAIDIGKDAAGFLKEEGKDAVEFTTDQIVEIINAVQQEMEE